MKTRLAVTVGVICAILVIGCSTGGSVGFWRLDAASNASAHAWETPRVDIETDNGVGVQVGVGVVSGGASIKLSAHDPNKPWVRANLSAGPTSD